MPIRLEYLLPSFRRHLRTASKPLRTIEQYSQRVCSFSQWLVPRPTGRRRPQIDPPGGPLTPSYLRGAAAIRLYAMGAGQNLPTIVLVRLGTSPSRPRCCPGCSTAFPLPRVEFTNADVGVSRARSPAIQF